MPKMYWMLLLTLCFPMNLSAQTYYSPAHWIQIAEYRVDEMALEEWPKESLDLNGPTSPEPPKKSHKTGHKKKGKHTKKIHMRSGGQPMRIQYSF